MEPTLAEGNKSPFTQPHRKPKKFFWLTLAGILLIALIVAVGVFFMARNKANKIVTGARQESIGTVVLGTAGNFSILAEAGISTIGASRVGGNIGVSPATASTITGFGLTKDSSKIFASSALVIGKVYAADYTPPTPRTMTTAVSDMETAYTAAAGVTAPAPVVELGAGNIGGRTLAPGVYKWSTGVTIPTDVTLDAQGDTNAVWIFQIAQTLDVRSAQKVILSGGAQVSNIFWQVAGQTTLGAESVFKGNILDLKAIVLKTGATLNGRALSQTAVTLNASTVSAAATATAPASKLTPGPNIKKLKPQA